MMTKYLLAAITLPIALAATPAMAQQHKCPEGTKCAQMHKPGLAENSAELRQTLNLKEKARKLREMQTAALADRATTDEAAIIKKKLAAYAKEQRNPCEHGDAHLDEHGQCTDCPEHEKTAANCVDCDEADCPEAV